MTGLYCSFVDTETMKSFIFEIGGEIGKNQMISLGNLSHVWSVPPSPSCRTERFEKKRLQESKWHTVGNISIKKNLFSFTISLRKDINIYKVSYPDCDTMMFYSNLLYLNLMPSKCFGQKLHFNIPEWHQIRRTIIQIGFIFT